MLIRLTWAYYCLWPQNFENYDVKEFAEGHIKGAILIDQFQSDFVEQAQVKLPKDKTIAIYYVRYQVPDTFAGSLVWGSSKSADENKSSCCSIL